MLYFACPKCAEEIEAPTSLAGQQGQCCACGAVIPVPRRRRYRRGTSADSEKWQEMRGIMRRLLIVKVAAALLILLVVLTIMALFCLYVSLAHPST